MFKKFVVCTLGLASGVAVASYSENTVNELVSFGSEKPAEVVQPATEKAELPDSWKMTDNATSNQSDPAGQPASLSATENSSFEAISGADVISLSDFHGEQEKEPVSVRVKTPQPVVKTKTIDTTKNRSASSRKMAKFPRSQNLKGKTWPKTMRALTLKTEAKFLNATLATCLRVPMEKNLTIE